MKRLSKHQSQLHNSHQIEHAFYPEVTVSSPTHGRYTLEGRLLSQDSSQPPSIMVIHGARADFTKADDVMLPLFHKGPTIPSATASGHGVAGHQTNTAFSLDDNLREAQAFSQLLSNNHRVLIGFSMGGTTAVRLLAQNPDAYDKLVLFYPAVFNDEVYAIPFGTDEFRKIASKKGSFLSSSFFEVIRTFKGKIMLIKGQYDGLEPTAFGKDHENAVFNDYVDSKEVYSPIPPEVFSRIMELRPDTEFFELPGADHQFAKWFASHPDDAKLVADKLYDFIVR